MNASSSTAPPAAPALPFDPRTTLGAWFGGNMVSLGLEGILFMLTMRYYATARRDMLYIRLLVHALFVMNILKSIQTVAVMWNQHITGFSDPDNFTSPPWYIISDTYNSILIKLVGQAFFAIRLYRFMQSRHWLVFPPLVGAMLLTFTASTACLSYAFESTAAAPPPGLGHKLFISLVAAACGIIGSDLIITFTTSYVFLRLKVGSKSADGLIDRLVNLTIVTAALPTLFCGITLGFFVSSGFDGSNDVFVASALIAPSLYSISVLHTLNIRGKFASRLAEDQQNAIHDLHLTTRELGSKAECSCQLEPPGADAEAPPARLSVPPSGLASTGVK